MLYEPPALGQGAVRALPRPRCLELVPQSCAKLRNERGLIGDSWHRRLVTHSKLDYRNRWRPLRKLLAGVR